MSFTYYLGMFYLFFFIIAMHKMGKICFTKKWQFNFPEKNLNDLFAYLFIFSYFCELD